MNLYSMQFFGTQRHHRFRRTQQGIYQPTRLWSESAVQIKNGISIGVSSYAIFVSFAFMEPSLAPFFVSVCGKCALPALSLISPRRVTGVIFVPRRHHFLGVGNHVVQPFLNVLRLPGVRQRPDSILKLRDSLMESGRRFMVSSWAHNDYRSTGSSTRFGRIPTSPTPTMPITSTESTLPW